MSLNMAYDGSIAEEQSAGFGDYIDELKRRMLSASLIMVAILLVGATITLLLPNTYLSTATVIIDAPEVPPGLVPTTVTTFAAAQLQYITQRVMTRSNLAEIIEKFDLYDDQRQHLPTLMLVEDAQSDMVIDLIDAEASDGRGRALASTIAFRLGFNHETPKTAQAVANELVSLYLAENVRTRTEQTAQTSDFLQAEVDQLDNQVKAIEMRIAEYKRENEDSLPEFNAMNMNLMNRIDSEILQIKTELDSLASTRIVIEAQLIEVDPMMPTLLATGEAVLAPEQQLRALQTQLAILEGRYGEDYPDVIRTRREVKALEKQLGIEGINLAATAVELTAAKEQLATARELYTDDHPEVIRLTRLVAGLQEKSKVPNSSIPTDIVDPDNPAYIQLTTQLKTIKSQEDALTRKEAELRRRLADYESKMYLTTEVERELSAMSRQMATATNEYVNARDKLFTAKLGQALETQSKGERFTLVEPADLPLEPSSPNRPVLLMLTVIIALAAGLGWPQLLVAMDPAVRGSHAIERIFGAPPIAEIPLIDTAVEEKTRRNWRLVGLLLVPAVIIIILAVVHFVVMPLDVLWYVAIRRFGL